MAAPQDTGAHTAEAPAQVKARIHAEAWQREMGLGLGMPKEAGRDRRAAHGRTP